MQIKIKKLIHNARLPEYKTSGSSGMDFYCPIDVTIPPKQTKQIPLGIALEIPEGYELQIRGRSGWSLNSSYLAKIGTVDNDYRGEICAIIHNLNTVGSIKFSKNDRLVQGVIQKVEKAVLTEVEELSITERNHNGFGHTGE